ncbi:putative TIM-barrel fold metal-dependent hydrolase [Cricetibacter osteomyelitidis]|uniref:Putative TIM-barrel fold metal-dependent hydrolase n=1 Tax=Cricetibacter osteomyelitidis TaxID=1521931 RepID=A0A4R2T3Q9_9PAST|nr:amidohydrolase family protein [Cricetibacter osteomyelitidis]TCP96920.1 putative TIM-barrel fold metal-dependent hydrolase [Cricetibacter osteomyelitidis]
MTSIKFTSTEYDIDNLQLPEGSCDSHHHIFNRAFPYAPDDDRNLPNATVQDYIALQQHLGCSKHIIVQPSSYGVDNNCLLNALQQGGEQCRGEAVIDNSFSDQQLTDLAERGIVGIRFNFGAGNYADVNSLCSLADRVLDYNWHIQLHAPADFLLEIVPHLMKIKNNLVFDHFARIPQPQGVNHPMWKHLVALLEKGKTWVKLSALYHNSKTTDFSDMEQITKALVQLAPERLLWGTDWPHPNLISANKPMPDDKYCLAKIYEWLDNDAIRQQVFVNNPDTLFFSQHKKYSWGV